jgi:hypothetical protein
MFAQGKVTLDCKFIQHWADARGGRPAFIRQLTPSGAEMTLSIVFPDSDCGQIVRNLSWEEFFEHFDRLKLAFIYQEGDEGQELSRFYAFV